jgi:hypothetical protein
MKIGELALAAQTQVETIRYYEREGLLPQAPRSEGNYRIYGPEHVERLEGGLAVSTHATTSFSPSRSARSRGERLRPAAVFEP